jgi:hypothetical protein
MSVFVTFRYVIMLHMKVTQCRSLCHPESMVALPSVDLTVRYVLQLKYKRAMKVRNDA